MDYETGVGAAVLCWLFYAASLLVRINSQTQRNLKKVGMRLSWVSNKADAWTGEDEKKSIWWSIGKYAVCIAIQVPFLLLSWIYAAYSVGSILWHLWKDLGAPQSVKEYRWKMRNRDMDFVEVVREMWKLNESTVPLEDFLAATADEVREKGMPTPGWVDHRQPRYYLGEPAAEVQDA